VDRRQAQDPPLRRLPLRILPSRNKMRIVADINQPVQGRQAHGSRGADPQPDRQVVQRTLVFPIADFKGWTGRRSRSRRAPLNGLYEIRPARRRRRTSPRARLSKTFERKKVSLGGHPVGHSTKVYPPFTPIKVDGKRSAPS